MTARPTESLQLKGSHTYIEGMAIKVTNVSAFQKPRSSVVFFFVVSRLDIGYQILERGDVVGIGNYEKSAV